MNFRNFEELHNKYQDRLIHGMIGFVKSREAAEDVASAAFAKAFKHRNDFRGDASFYSWLYAISVNEAHLWLRRNRGEKFESLDEPGREELGAPDMISERMERSESCLRIRKVLRRIPAAYRRTLRDRFVHGYSVKSMARREKVPVGTILSRIFNGKKFLRQAWEA